MTTINPTATAVGSNIIFIALKYVLIISLTGELVCLPDIFIPPETLDISASDLPSSIYVIFSFS